METFLEILKNPFVWGLAIGLFLFVLSFWSHWRTKSEFSRFRRLLTDKLELESKQYESLREENAELRKEAENLRHKVTHLGEKPENQRERDLEIFARAEKHMMVQAPGFAPAWETAKSQALEAMEEEEPGKSLPKRIFRKFFGSGGGGAQPAQELPVLGEVQQPDPEPEPPAETAPRRPVEHDELW